MKFSYKAVMTILLIMTIPLFLKGGKLIYDDYNGNPVVCGQVSTLTPEGEPATVERCWHEKEK